jgi:hypothetical protein
MKKHLLYLMFIVLAFVSCKKTNDPIFEAPDVRLKETTNNYQSQLSTAQFGWRGYLLTATNRVETFLFNFNDKNRVVMSATYKTAEVESSYIIKALQKPTLIFDTYSTLHLLADPTNSVAGGSNNNGFGSDFEFEIISSTPDTIRLQGIYNDSKLILIRSMEQADNTTAFAPTAATTAINTELSKFKTYFKRVLVGDTECEILINTATKNLSLTFSEGGEFKNLSSLYFISNKSIVLYNPIKVGNNSFSSLNNISYDAATGFINTTTNIAGKPIQLKEAISPINYNKEAPKLFMLTTAKQWRSANAFTFEGQADVFKVKSITNFNRLIHVIRSSGDNDLIGFVFGNTINFGIRVSPIINGDGIIKYTFVALDGVISATADPIVKSVSSAITSPEGYYVIQTGTNTFDLVSVKDARTWINYI